MASAKFQGGKCQGSAKAKAFLMHDEKEQRLSHEHTNEHIDKAKTELNTSAYGLSYEEACAKYDKRIAELDATTNTNKRKDRVTMQSIEIPVPKGLPHEKHQEFFDNVKDILCEMYGETNLVEAYYHFDEEHEYTDPETKQKEMSRNHGHYNFIPEHEGQLNGKWFSSRANMKKLNGAIDRMAQKEFGMSFMDGSKRKGKKTVEQLKNESKEAELIQQMQDQVDRDKQKVLYARQHLLEVEVEQHQREYDMDSIALIQSDKEKELETKEKRLDEYDEEILQGVSDLRDFEASVSRYYTDTIQKAEQMGDNTRASRMAGFMGRYKIQGKDLYQIFQEEEPKIIAQEKQNEMLLRDKIDREYNRIQSRDKSMDRNYGYDI